MGPGRWPTTAAKMILFAFLFTACGTLELGMEPGLTPSAEEAQPIATSIAEPPEETVSVPTPTLFPPTPVPTELPLPGDTPQAPPTAEPATPTTEEPSALWSTYRDPEYGFGYAYPCFWLNLPSTTSSYDENFALENTVRGQWIDNQPPAGVVKIDIGVLDYAEYGLDLELPLGEAITAVAGDPYGDGRPAFETIEETTLAGRVAQRVYLGQQQDSWGGDFERESYYFPIEPGRWFRFFVLPTEAIHTPSVQGILESLALTVEESVVAPTFAPDSTVESREYYVNEEAGICFQYPAEFALEEYAAGVAVGQTASLKLERPLYTVGLTVQARQVGEGAALDELVSGYLNSFSEQAAAEIRRNPQELVAGVDYRLGGEPAEALDGVPGPVNSLDLLTKYRDRLVQIVFSPSPFDNPQASSDLWTLYNVVTTSFSFLP